jgi:intraflagellar transport protein 172
LILEYAIEHGEFAEAFKIGEKMAPQKVCDIHLNYAMALEDNGEFLKAEEHFILAKKPREAIDMYTHQQDWESAMRIAEQHDKSAVSEIYDAQAKLYRSQKQFNQAEQLYLGAKRPEQAIEMYVEVNLFDDAVRIARIHCPRLLAQIEHDKRTYARMHAPGMENTGMRADHGLKQEQESKMHSRYHDEDDDENDRIVQIQKKKAGGAQSSQDIIEGYAQNGEWARVFETLQSTKLLTEEMKTEMRLEYSSRHAHELVSNEKYISALRVLDKHGFALEDTFFPLYKRLAMEVLSRAGVVMEDMNDETYLEHIQTRPTDELALMTITQSRRMLYKLYTDLRTSDPHCQFLSELEILLNATHFYMLRLQSGNVNVPQLYLKQAISCLRYANLLPVDKVFYEAGSASKESHIENMAFVCWNRFVDILDIWYSEQGQQSDIDNSDFIMTDIPTPFDTPMPKFSFYTEDKVEEVRQWILEKAMSVSNAHQLSMSKCEKCHADMYEATLHCPHCQTQYTPCVVTGYPVFRSKKVNCSLCNAASNREDWNRYVNKTKQCAWCCGTQTPYY